MRSHRRERTHSLILPGTQHGPGTLPGTADTAVNQTVSAIKEPASWRVETHSKLTNNVPPGESAVKAKRAGAGTGWQGQAGC